MTDAMDIARQRRQLAAIIAVVVVADQLVKWWTWRHVDGVLINSGGYILLGSDIRAWFATPIGGAVADVVGTAALIVAVMWIARQHRPTGVLLGAALIVGGWTSNILDRLGLHNVTAPGSARGVVDFIPDGSPGRSNTADVCIAVGVVLLGYSVVRRRWSGERHDRNSGGHVPGIRACLVVVIVLLAVIALAVTSALDHDGVHAPKALLLISTARLCRCDPGPRRRPTAWGWSALRRRCRPPAGLAAGARSARARRNGSPRLDGWRRSLGYHARPGARRHRRSRRI